MSVSPKRSGQKTGSPKVTIPAGAKQKPMPRKVEVMKATLVDEPFSRAGWLFENKWDGMRAIAFIDRGTLRLVSRNNKVITPSYPELHDIPAAVNAGRAIIDGEIVMKSKGGGSNFELLASRFGVTNEAKIKVRMSVQHAEFEVFDLLYLDGYDLTAVPLLERKYALKAILRKSKSTHYTKHVLRTGEGFFAKVKKAHGEGMIAKDIHSKYVHHRSTDWLKVKTSMRQEVVIVGYTVPHGSREHFGALQLGLYEGGKLISIGQVGTGFSRDTLRDLYKLMQPLRVKKQPFAVDPELKEEIQWLKPKLVCEVRFSEWTSQRRLRHPSFEGLRTDKTAKDCTFEKPKILSALVAKRSTAKK